MATASGPEEKIQDREAAREEWLGRLGALVDDVKRWAEPFGWFTRLISKKMEDSRLGDYRAPALLLQKDTVGVLLDPIARFAPGTEGVVDLYLMPAYDDIASLYLVDGRWCVTYLFDSPDEAMPKIAEAAPLDREVLGRILDAMSRHAA
jgi:hypothetical protein